MKHNSREKSQRICTALIIMMIIMISGCSAPDQSYKEESFIRPAYNEVIPDAVHMYVSATASPFAETWAEAKEEIKTRMEVFAGEFAYRIEDRGDILYIVAEKAMFSDESISDTMTYFITEPLRFGLYLPENYDLKLLNKESIASVCIEGEEKSKGSRIRISLSPEDAHRLDDFRQNADIEFAFSLGSTFYEIPAEWDENDNCVLYLKNEMDERYQALQYYDLTHTMPYVKTTLSIYPHVIWEEPPTAGNTLQRFRSGLIGPVKEVIYGYGDGLFISEVEYDNTLSVLKKRLEVLGYEYALGECYEDKRVIIAFGNDCPDNFTLQMLGSNVEVSLRKKYNEVAYEKTPSVIYGAERERYVALSEEMPDGNPVIDFSEYGKELLYDLTAEAAQSKNLVSVLINGYPLGYSLPESAVCDGKLVLDAILPECNLEECSFLLSQIAHNNEGTEMLIENIPVELSVTRQYICDGSLIREPLKSWSCYEGMADTLQISLSSEIPRLVRIDADDTINFYLRANHGKTVVQDYIQDINQILESFPYSKCSFREMKFLLCDSDDAILYMVVMTASRYYSMKSAENSVDIYSVNLNVEKMDPYRAELNHICDEGVIRYE